MQNQESKCCDKKSVLTLLMFFFISDKAIEKPLTTRWCDHETFSASVTTIGH